MNCIGDFARSDVVRRTPHLATQPELGVLPKRRTGLGSGHSGCPAFAGQDLSQRGANSDALCDLGTVMRDAGGSVGLLKVVVAVPGIARWVSAERRQSSEGRVSPHGEGPARDVA